MQRNTSDKREPRACTGSKLRPVHCDRHRGMSPGCGRSVHQEARDCSMLRICCGLTPRARTAMARPAECPPAFTCYLAGSGRCERVKRKTSAWFASGEGFWQVLPAGPLQGFQQFTTILGINRAVTRAEVGKVSMQFAMKYITSCVEPACRTRMSKSMRFGPDVSRNFMQFNNLKILGCMEPMHWFCSLVSPPVHSPPALSVPSWCNPRPRILKFKLGVRPLRVSTVGLSGSQSKLIFTIIWMRAFACFFFNRPLLQHSS